MEKNVKYRGELNLAGMIIPCYVLDNGTRVISGRGMQEALKMVDEAEEGRQTAGTRLSRYLSQKSLNPFIYKDKGEDHFKPIVCNDGGSKINGYEATVLVDICDAFLEARKSISLSPRQEIIAAQCEILVRAFAKVGIVALVDEATGYQADKNRAKDELQKFLSQFITEEASKWVKTFNDSFFEMIYRMHNWDWTMTHKRPGVVGKWINDIVYERIGPIVLAELERVNPKNEKGARKERHHQHLTEDVGRPKLREHLTAVEALGRASGYDWAKFMQMLDTAFPKQYQQLSLLFPEDVNQGK
ncbi:P63C domain-containing protein [uncultured Alistipes sp.]|jgi:hypothetical protein|uniref:P63C domain-containing protein n=1 Tax=uncultured Alistipes sp. TaxID=538949 RepID=UPI00266C0D38|nr:P63C domain-containing protein [uncultured Alistipes sp.]